MFGRRCRQYADQIRSLLQRDVMARKHFGQYDQTNYTLEYVDGNTGNLTSDVGTDDLSRSAAAARHGAVQDGAGGGRIPLAKFTRRM
jgi:hypothetical protein